MKIEKNNKKLAVVLELIPLTAALITFILIKSQSHSELSRNVSAITMILAFSGFVFYLLGRKLAREEPAVRILGIFDLLSTAAVIGFYILAIFSFGL